MDFSKFKMPHTFVIIFFVVCLAALLRMVIPVGVFETEKVTYSYNGKEKSKTVIKPETFKIVKDESGNSVRKPVALFASHGEISFLNYIFEGLSSGSKWGTAVGIIAFILVVGGAFGMILKTGAVETVILTIMSKTGGKEILLIPILFSLFSLGGAIFGMGEEAIPFAMILIPMVVAMGYDSITGILITYIATQIGFATSWMNPFSVAIAQGIAGIPILSGASFRIVMWIIFTIVGIVFTWLYASKIKRDPKKSLSYKTDEFFRNNIDKQKDLNVQLSIGHILVLLTIFLGMIWVVWGVTFHEYYIPSIAAQFFTMGLVSGLIGVIFKLNKMTVNDMATSFHDGAKDLLMAALVVGMAKGIILVLGGDKPTEPNVLNTILHYMGSTVSHLPQTLSAFFMFNFETVINFFVVSGSGQAALTMPIMAPLATIIGISKQIAVLSFQLGDGLTNMIVPTSGCLMGMLGVARIDWGTWFKFQIKFQFGLYLLAGLFLTFAVFTNYS